MVAAQHGRVAAPGGDAVQFVEEVLSGHGALDQAAEAFAGLLVHDGHDLDRSPVGGGVELEVDGPHPVRCVRLRRVRCRARPQPLASPLLRHWQAFLAPPPLDLLVVDVPALVAGVVVGVANPRRG
jgi:hypothetical protein